MEPVLSCPVCGQGMRLILTEFNEPSPPLYIYECAQHGRYHVSEAKPLTPGMPK